MITGCHATDYSDASGMLLLDVKNKCWSKVMCDICGVNTEWLPKLFESYDVIGKMKEEFNLPNAIVTAGEGENAAAAIGTGTVRFRWERAAQYLLHKIIFLWTKIILCILLVMQMEDIV